MNGFDEDYEEQLAEVQKMIDNLVGQILPDEIPFEQHRVLTTNFLIFGHPFISVGDGMVGRHVRFFGGDVEVDGSIETLIPCIGHVLVENHGQIIMAIEREHEVYSFLGWLRPEEDFEFVSVIQKDQRWHH
jgi:hypothetical protein